jgi:hypothetical protein
VGVCGYAAAVCGLTFTAPGAALVWVAIGVLVAAFVVFAVMVVVGGLRK